MQLAVRNTESTTIKLYREFNNTINLAADLPGVITDTTIIDDDNGAGLLLDTTYSYYAVIIDSTGNVKDTSNTVTARTLAPTTHNYTWTEYTIGEWQSALYDVWGTDENNVYAVGTVALNNTYYGVIRWDGNNWLPEKEIGGLSAVYGFTGNDIWVAGTLVFHFDGNNWTEVNDPVLNDNIPYTSIWGTSSSNLYFGNQWGKIIHWDGEKAEVMDVQAGESVRDIRGLNENEIYATTGTTEGLRPGQLYYYDGVNWTLIKTASLFPGPGELHGPLYSVWLYDRYELYTAGGRIARRVAGNWSEISVGFFSDKIRGTKPNNIFAVGHSGNAAHFNGEDWYTYQFNTNTILESVFVTENQVFFVGLDQTKAFIYIGRKQK
jgi:hypothetical protein